VANRSRFMSRSNRLEDAPSKASAPHARVRGSISILRGLVILALALVLVPAPAAGTASQPGLVAVYRDTIPITGDGTASPEYLASLLEQAGWAVEFLDGEGMADAAVLDRARVDVLVLPYGPAFPVAAAECFRRFLRAGGKLFSTGGYAFDALYERSGPGWRAYQPPLPPRDDGVAWFHEMPAEYLRGQGRLTFRGFLKTDGVAGPGFAHFSVYQAAADGSLPTWRDLCQVRGTTDWREHTFTFDVHPQAATVSLRAGLYRCRGTAWFDDVQVVNAAGEALLASTFAQAPEADRREPRNWWRSQPERCAWETNVVRSGPGALRATLDFALPRVERLNTRHGRPEDGLEVEPSQLGVFQADYPLERAVSLRAAPEQSVLPMELSIEGPASGWAACGIIGRDAARWVPLLATHDRYGRPRGAAGGLLRHSSGTWRGSSWAVFGVTNRNLFSAAEPRMADAFVRIVRALAADSYFASLTTEHACYQEGDSVEFRAPIFHGGRRERRLRARVEIRAGDLGEGDPEARFSFDEAVAPGQTNVVSARWQPPHFTADFYHLRATLSDGTEEVDRIEGGFVVRDERVIASGPRLRYHDNYLHLGDRPVFQFGTDDWGYVFDAVRETPRQWLADMRLRRDLGVTLYENLQFGMPDPGARREELLRRVDGIVQLAQKHGQIYFAGLLIGQNAAASDADLARQSAYCGEFARRYARVPGLIYYLNGDYRCTLGDAVTPQWNQFLQERYGSDSALRQAWGPWAAPESLGAIPSADYHDWEQAWDDVSAYDRNAFRARLIRRWNGSLIHAIRQHDAAHPTSGEFYQLPHSGVDLPAGIDGLDLANFGFFERPGADLVKFPALCLLNDQRARGKSGGPGEYGVKTHPAWGDGRDYGYHTARTRAQAMDLFLTLPHDALGLGASRMHTWCWKDDAHRVFPWGMVYPADGVPKDIAYAHRNLSLLFRHFAPVYREPEAWVLTPDCHRLGGGKWPVTDGILTSFELALATHPPGLGTLNESGLAIPQSARVLFYPIPYCLTDAAFAQLLRWVEQGGVLYTSGDLAYDELRRETRPERLAALCGVRRLARRHPPLGINTTNAAAQLAVRVEPVTATVRLAAPDGSPLVVENRVGRGRVIYTPDPIELHSTPARRDEDVALYRRVLELGGVRPLSVDPDTADLKVYRVPLEDGGAVWIVANRDPSQAARSVTLTGTPVPVTLGLAGPRPGLVWFDGSGALRAVETRGECRVAGERTVRDETGGVVLSLDEEGVHRSRAVLLMPVEPGRIEWSTRAPWAHPRVETGDFENGKWRIGATAKINVGEGQVHVDVAEDQALSLLLVCEESALLHWRRILEQAITCPETLP